MAFRLWLFMMILVVVSIAFMWVGQIFLFEHNYVEASIKETQIRMEPVMEDLKTNDLAENEELISLLSKSTNGKIILMDQSGALIAMYSYGHPIQIDEAENESKTWRDIKESKEYQEILAGEPYKKVIYSKNQAVAYEVGVPGIYNGEKIYVLTYHPLGEISTVLDMNRRQLTTLSLSLTIIAAIIAAILARVFTRPIHEIKDAVDQLTLGNLEATPNVSQKDELGQLSDSVKLLGKELNRVEVLRKEVIANVSHELRSPLALITGYAELVRDISWSDEEKRNEHLNLIIDEGTRLSEMVSDIMDYSQFQAGYIQLKKEEYNLYEIVESEVYYCEPDAAKHHISMVLESVEMDIPVVLDALKISQVMRNLLYNAINHTNDGGTIEIKIEQLEEKYRVMVINPGKPIPEEEQKLIWERYHSTDHHGGRNQGTGLGLSIVSTILKAHNMAYGVECKEGKIVFWFSYPPEETL